MTRTVHVLLVILCLTAEAYAFSFPGMFWRRLSDFKSNCSQGCSLHGTCNEELGRCDCPHTFKGDACQAAISNAAEVCKDFHYKLSECMNTDLHTCLNSCNHRGSCLGGFCHCNPGFYGTDCALSLDSQGRPELLAGQNYTRRRKGPAIYIYELPPEFISWIHMDRFLIVSFWQRLLSSGVRTPDPEQADYFFIPADMGRVETSPMIRNITRNSIWLTHWGLDRDSKGGMWQASHRPGLDIVVPVIEYGTSFSIYKSPLNPWNEQAPRHRFFFFAGTVCQGAKPDLMHGPERVCGGSSYSNKIRGKVFYYHHMREGWTMVPKVDEVGVDMGHSRFCLAPPGAGHGKRQVLAALQGCIPVVIGDNIFQPFEPELKWSQFSVRVKEDDIPNLHYILGNISDFQLIRMQAHLRCAAHHLWYASLRGSVFADDGRYDAMETLFAILRVRLRHPDWPPQKYAEDAEFGPFMRCASDGDPLLQPLSTPLCWSHFHQRHPVNVTSCGTCFASRIERVGTPGGPFCCRHYKELATCPRVWV